MSFNLGDLCEMLIARLERFSDLSRDEHHALASGDLDLQANAATAILERHTQPVKVIVEVNPVTGHPHMFSDRAVEVLILRRGADTYEADADDVYRASSKVGATRDAVGCRELVDVDAKFVGLAFSEFERHTSARNR